MSLPRKALIAVTSAHAPLYPNDEETGLFITEALHPYEIFKKAGIDVVFASEDGTYKPDWLSLQADWLSGDDKTTYENQNSDFRKALDGLKKASDLNPSDFGIFFAAGGHATLLDFPEAKDLQSLGTKIFANGGIVSAVCHGPAILAGIKDSKTGESILTGRKVTGFTDEGEKAVGALEAIEKWKKDTIQTSADKYGATYVSPSGPWEAFTQTDRRLVTGVNPQSAAKTAEETLKAFNGSN